MLHTHVPRPTRARRSLGFLFVVALVAAGCGGGNGGEEQAESVRATEAPTTTTTAPPPTTTPPTTIDPARVARARAAVLQPGDFPAGWETQPPDEGLFIDQLWQDLTRCLGVESAAQPAVTATSPTYKRGIATQARTRVDYTSPASAQAIAAALAGPKAQQCLTQAFTADAERSKPDDATPGPSTVSPLQLPQQGDKTMAWRVNVTMNLSDLQVPIFQDFVVVFRNDGTVIPMFFLNPGGPFPPDLERQLRDKVVSRA